MPLTIPVPRHLEPHPEDVRPRLARLGHPDEMTGLEPPVQRLANFLIAAERNLSDVQSRFFEARRDGDPDAMATLTAQWEAAERAVGSFRLQLYQERRRQLLLSQPARVDATAPRSLLQRFFVR